MQLLNHRNGCLVDTPFQVHWVHARCNGTQAFCHDGLRQYGCSGGTITGHIVGLGSHFFNHLGAHVFELVFQLDFFGYRYTVFSDGGGTKSLVQNHVAAFRAQSYLDCVCQYVNAFDHFGAGAVTEFNFFSCHDCFLLIPEFLQSESCVLR